MTYFLEQIKIILGSRPCKYCSNVCGYRALFKVHIFWEGHKILQIFPLLLSYVVPVKNKGKISQNFVAFSEYMNFTIIK